MKVVIAGGSGFIGQALAQEFTKDGGEVVLLSRKPHAPDGRIRTVVWSASELGDWAKELDGADLVINLTGASISMPWTPENRRQILESRVNSARVIGAALSAAEQPPTRWINASAIGYYGDTGDTEVDENSPPVDAESFLVSTCKAWEAAAHHACPAQVRLSIIRIGLVQGRDGGAFPVLYKLARAFLGGTVGSGRQWQSWIHISDLVRLFRFIHEKELDGVVNAVAPHPVPMAEYMETLRRVVHRPWSPPVPAFALKLVGKLGGPPAELVLFGQRVRPRRARETGFEFKFPDLQLALEEITK